MFHQGVWLLVLTSCSSLEINDEMIARYREKVRAMFYHAYNGYLNHAFPLDELKPISCTGHDTWGSFSLSLVDALDTLIVMGNTTEFRRAVDLVLKNVRTDANVNVSVFETNIRIVGGLVSAHMLSGRVEGMVLEDGWPCSGPLLRLAEAMAARLLPAFNTETGMPYGTVNLKYGVPKSETPITCTAGVGTFIVEFGALSRLTGDPQFERVALKALESLWRTRSSLGLVGNHINVRTGQWTATDTGIGAGVDSYFEYLVKGALLLQRPALMEQFHEYASAINRYVRKGDWFMWVTMTKGAVSLPVFHDSAVRFSTRVLQRWLAIQNSAAEKRAAFPLRPEIAESLMYLYRATEDPQFLEIAAQLVDAIEHSAKTPCGYATINNVNDHSIEDRMESFFLAETTKYLYLIFDPNNFLHNDGQRARIVDTPNGECVVDAGGYIFNTEAHPIDPAIVHCCSAQRQAEREAVRKWEDNYDLLTILDHRDTVSPMLLRKESVPEILTNLKNIREDVHYLPNTHSPETPSRTELDVEFEVDESFILGASKNESQAELRLRSAPSNESNEKLLTDIFAAITKDLSRKKATPPPKPWSAKKAFRFKSKPGNTALTQEEILQKVRALIHRARLEDERKREMGESANSAEELVETMAKIHSEYAELIKYAKELDDEYFELMMEREEKARAAAMVPVVTAACQVKYELGPLCWTYETPRVEDHYRNVAPVVLPSTVIDKLRIADIEQFGFELLTTPPLGFSYKFVGEGQVALSRNTSYVH
ncbi:glycosyl hydrolase family 47 [Cooperia oncophora]